MFGLLAYDNMWFSGWFTTCQSAQCRNDKRQNL